MTAYKLRCHKCDYAEYPGPRELVEHLYAEHGDLLETTAEDEDTPWDAISQLRGADVMSDALLFSADAEIERLHRMLRLKWEDLRMLHVAGESYNDWVDDLRDRVGKGWMA